jgi:SAM-dependent methyltransferase
MSAPATLDRVTNIFAAMRSHTLSGAPLSDVVGGGDPQAIALEILTAITAHANLAPGAAVLDIGCGCGRIATALTQHLSSEGRYAGVDIVPELIRFAQAFITAAYPNFRFFLLNDRNQSYDKLRGENAGFDIARLEDAGAAGSFDFVLSVSLFTHLDFPAASEMLASAARLLKPGGSGFVTFFVVNEETAERMKLGQTGFSFRHTSPSGRVHTEQKDEPTAAVAYDQTTLEELIGSAGLHIANQLPGYWSSGVPGVTFQDAVIVGKSAP